jgi:hypothetical protein
LEGRRYIAWASILQDVLHRGHLLGVRKPDVAVHGVGATGLLQEEM